MSNEFRELLKKVGSGAHTHKDLTMEEAGYALEMMLQEVATPAQIGAFLIAHRIKRPTAAELAGMLQTYNRFGQKVAPLQKKYPLTILGIPYDGRTRNAPISPITALILTASDVPVLMHGGTKMPTKYGLTLAQIWQNLGVDLTQLSIEQVNQLLAKTNFGFLYLPNHFPLANNLVKYRDQIGKRPPLATLELIWQPYQDTNSHLMAGYVHPPTEKMIRGALNLTGVKKFTLIKGMEGSGDLKLSQTNIIVCDRTDLEAGFEYLKINPSEYQLDDHDPLLTDDYSQQIKQTIAGKTSALTKSSLLNGGFYLWRCGVSEDIATGIKMSEELINSGKLQNQLDLIREQVRQFNTIS